MNNATWTNRLYLSSYSTAMVLQGNNKEDTEKMLWAGKRPTAMLSKDKDIFVVATYVRSTGSWELYSNEIESGFHIVGNTISDNPDTLLVEFDISGSKLDRFGFSGNQLWLTK